jgi:FtsP/CotA-like multicopper oxidase with cupredoxin domain
MYQLRVGYKGRKSDFSEHLNQRQFTMLKFSNMLAPTWVAVLLFYSPLANAIPSPTSQSPPSVIEERQVKGSCADYGAASNKLEPDPLVQKREDGWVGDGQPYVAYQWVVTEGHITVHGGCKFMHLINGNWPPPPIVVNHGTVIKLEVINRMPNDPITLHAHGLDQKNTQWMDGPEALTQRYVSNFVQRSKITILILTQGHWTRQEVYICL